MARNDDHVALFSVYEDFVPWDTAYPEKNLLRAMIITAMYDLKKSGRIRAEALRFFKSEDLSNPFSFRSICDVLDIDADLLRKYIGIDEIEKNNSISPCDGK